LLVASCIGRPTSIFTNTLILQSSAAATHGHSVNLIFALSLASYLSLYPLLLLPPLLILCYDAQVRRTKRESNKFYFTIAHIAGISVILGGLLYLSQILTGSWQFLHSTYGVWLLLPDLTPNSGLWWYFFTEMFDSFREFFLGVFWLHMASYVAGLCFRLRAQPLFIIISLLGVFAIFMPYPSIAESGLFLSVLPLYRHVFPREYTSAKRELG
jgi:GPI-anchor transamidase subunit U